MIHVLKTWPPYYDAVVDGRKSFEVRKADRDFAVDDSLMLAEWDPNTGLYTGRTCERVVTYIMNGGCFGLDSDYCVMGIRAPSEAAL